MKPPTRLDFRCRGCSARFSLTPFEAEHVYRRINCAACLVSVCDDNGTFVSPALREQARVLEDAVMADRGMSYGLTAERYREMLAAQRDSCAICLTRPVRRFELVIDHNHETGEVRGLLCSACNTALGFFKDSPGRLAAALDYLRERGHYGEPEYGELGVDA